MKRDCTELIWTCQYLLEIILVTKTKEKAYCYYHNYPFKYSIDHNSVWSHKSMVYDAKLKISTYRSNPIMHQSHIPQCTILCIVGYVSKALWDLWDGLIAKIEYRSYYITLTSHECHGVSHHRRLDYLFNSFFRPTSKKTSRFYITAPL